MQKGVKDDDKKGKNDSQFNFKSFPIEFSNCCLQCSLIQTIC